MDAARMAQMTMDDNDDDDDDDDEDYLEPTESELEGDDDDEEADDDDVSESSFTDLEDSMVWGGGGDGTFPLNDDGGNGGGGAFSAMDDISNSKYYVEGDLSYKFGKSAGASRKWKNGFVTLALSDGGSIRCIPPSAITDESSSRSLSLTTNNKQSASKRRRKRRQKRRLRRKRETVLTARSISELCYHEKPDLEIPPLLNYVVKDIRKDEFRFLVEIEWTNNETEETDEQPTTREAIPEARPNEETEEEQQYTNDNHRLSSPDLDPGGISPIIEDDEETTTDQESNNNSTSIILFGNLIDAALQDALTNSQRNGKPLRIYFRCNFVNEKRLWISAFQRLGRFQEGELRRKKGWTALTSTFTVTTSRKRDTVGQQFIEDCRILLDEAGDDSYHSWQERMMSSQSWKTSSRRQQEQQQQLLSHSVSSLDKSSEHNKLVSEYASDDLVLVNDDDKQNNNLLSTNSFGKGGDELQSTRTINSNMDGSKNGSNNDDDDDDQISRKRRNDKKKDTEYLVQPSYAYPNRWMTSLELHNEMLKTSSVFHDLRRPGLASRKEIGTLKVEVLQCLGLPKLDIASATDALVYFVCGSYAFVTDIIWNRQNPVWLCKTRRACIFPLFDGFARLYAGVFDDDGQYEADDFAGRVVIDLARCRPRSTYDVTIPLRSSAHVYATRKLGAIRLRFSLEWHSERDALLSYIPRQLPNFKPRRRNDDLTVLCADEKAFRNIAITVHGSHLPGSFSIKGMRAVMLEINFTRKRIFFMVEAFLLDVVYWRIPRVSILIFSAWMHSSYVGQFSLVPAYIFLFLFLLLMNNYFHFVADDSFQNGFIPPSWEEMLMVLLSSPRKSKGAIEPLDMKPNKSTYQERSEENSTATATNTSSGGVQVSTHRPQGLWAYRALSGTSGNRRDNNNDIKEMDFPFSQGLEYPQLDVAQSLATVRGGIAGIVKSKDRHHKIGYHGRDGGDFGTSRRQPKMAELVDDDAELCSDISKAFADGISVSVNGALKGAASGLDAIRQAGVHKVGSAAGNGVALIGSVAGTGAKKIGKGGKNVGKRVSIVAGSGINTTRKVGQSVANVAGSGLHKIGSAATKVGSIADSGMDKIGIKKVGKTLGKVATGVGNAADTGIDKVGLKKVGRAFGSSAGAAIHTIGSAAETGIKGVGKTTKKAGKVTKTAGKKVVKTAGKAVEGTKKAGQVVTKKTVLAVDTVGGAAGAKIGKLSKTTKQVGKAIKFAMSSKEKTSYDRGEPSVHASLREFYPEQNVDLKIRKTTKKSLADELEDFKHHMHRCTLHVFNDRAYVVRNPEACYFNEAKKSESRKSSNVHQDLDRVLETGAYSNPNPLVAQVGVYLEPMVAAALSFLSMFRAVHNIFTWQDPMLSFWVSLFFFAAAAILFMFPWRFFFFVTGLVLTGPQNFALRRFHEMGKLPDSLQRLVRGPLHPSQRMVPQYSKTEFDVKEIPKDQPIVCAPKGEHHPFRQLEYDEVDPREIHEISVPYSRLMYQRFYDWPPEAQYARVERQQDANQLLSDGILSSSTHSKLPLPNFDLDTSISNRSILNVSARTNTSVTSTSSKAPGSPRPDGSMSNRSISNVSTRTNKSVTSSSRRGSTRPS